MKEPVSIVECCDCMDFMAKYPDKYFELSIVDVPYGINMAARGNVGSERGFNKSGSKTYSIQRYSKKNWDLSAPDENYFDELFRVSKNQIIWGANHFISRIPFDSSCWIVWDKDNSGNYADCELAWASFPTAVKKFKYRWNGMLQEEMDKKEVRMHPTQKPVKLYTFCLENYAKEGDKILDTHLGSGSSRIAAYKLGFDFYGCEIDREYFEAQEARFKKAIAEPLFDSVKEVKQSDLFNIDQEVQVSDTTESDSSNSA